MRSPLGNWALVDKYSERMIGALCFEKVDERQLSAELSYFLKRLLEKRLNDGSSEDFSVSSFYEIGLKEITIITHEENVASQMVAKKLVWYRLRSIAEVTAIAIKQEII